MQKLFTALALGLLLAGGAQAGPATTSPNAYAGVAATAAERQGGGTKVSPKVFGGHAFSDSLAVEAGYIDFSKATPAPDARTIDLGGFGSYVALKLTRPLIEKLSAYGMLGVAHSQRKSSANGVVRKESDTGAYGAFGLQYAITKDIKASAGYERYGKDKKSGAKADAWTLGLEFAF